MPYQERGALAEKGVLSREKGALAGKKDVLPVEKTCLIQEKGAYWIFFFSINVYFLDISNFHSDKESLFQILTHFHYLHCTYTYTCIHVNIYKVRLGIKFE